MIETRSTGGQSTHTHKHACVTYHHMYSLLRTVKSCMTPPHTQKHKHTHVFPESLEAEKSRRKSARPHQIFTQEQLYCRNITHRSRSVIRSILVFFFSSSLSVFPHFSWSPPLLPALPLPSPPRAAEMHLGSGPMPLAARVLYMCTEPRSA